MEGKSSDRFPKKIARANIEMKHKKNIFATKGTCFKKLEDLAILIYPLFPEKSINRESQVCKVCYESLGSRFIVSSSLAISESDNETNDTPTFSSQSSSCLSDSGELFTPPENIKIEEFNRELRGYNLNISPLKQPTTIEKKLQRSYAVKKRKQIIESFSCETASKMRKLYDVPLTVEFEAPFACEICKDWMDNLKISLQNCTSTSEKIRLLSILPNKIPQNQILRELPGVTQWMIKAARRLKETKGEYHTIDPYNGHPINEDIVRLVHSYYLDDDLDCSRQSLNKNDAINVTENGEKQECVFQECKNCPGENGISFTVLGIPNEAESEEITYAIWEKADLVKKTTSIDSYLEELKSWTLKASLHFACKQIQQKAIRDEKELVKNSSSHLLLHVDFAENWSVILKDEIQSYHWQNKQISIFTAVCYFGDLTQSFAIVSDDKRHDSAYALMAMDIMVKYVEGKCPDRTINNISIISDGAASQFKNRFQYTELKNSVRQKKWIFSTTGHGKGACDGVGGLVKHFATKHNLSKEHIEAIQNASSFVETVQKYTSAIKLCLIRPEELQLFRESKTEEWKNVKAIKGIQKTHVWKKDIDTNCTFTARTSQHPWVEEATI